MRATKTWAETSEEFIEQYLERVHERAEKFPGLWIPRERVAAVVRDWMGKHEREAVGACWAQIPQGELKKRASCKKILAARAGITERAIWRLLCEDIRVKARRRGPRQSPWMIDGGEPYLSFSLVDRLFIAMDRVYLWYVPPEDGGFSDIYWAGMEEAA